MRGFGRHLRDKLDGAGTCADHGDAFACQVQIMPPLGGMEFGACKIIDGLGMLVAQAAESFAVWRGIRPGTKQVITELRKNMGML